jgi:hypothetical protein
MPVEAQSKRWIGYSAKEPRETERLMPSASCDEIALVRQAVDSDAEHLTEQVFLRAWEALPGLLRNKGPRPTCPHPSRHGCVPSISHRLTVSFLLHPTMRLPVALT